MKRWKKWLLTLLILLLLVPATLLVLVVATERGLRMATRTVDRIGRLGARISVMSKCTTAMPISSPAIFAAGWS
jgi:autotransporter translocation and assembly factor TamB